MKNLKIVDQKPLHEFTFLKRNKETYHFSKRTSNRFGKL